MRYVMLYQHLRFESVLLCEHIFIHLTIKLLRHSVRSFRHQNNQDFIRLRLDCNKLRSFLPLVIMITNQTKSPPKFDCLTVDLKVRLYEVSDVKNESNQIQPPRLTRPKNVPVADSAQRGD